MRKAKRYLGLVLACVLSVSNIPLKTVLADSDISSLEVSVVGDGDVIIDDFESKYPLESGDTFKANVTLDTHLKITANSKTGSSIKEVTLNGVKLTSVDKGSKTASFEYIVPKEGGKVVVYFDKDIVHTPPVQDKPLTNPKEEVKKEEPKKDVVAEDKKESEKVIPNKDMIIEEYLKGVYDSKTSVEFRKHLVEENNLQAYVNKDFFFKEEYLNSLVDLETIGDFITLVDISKKDLSTKYSNKDADDTLVKYLESRGNSIKSFLRRIFNIDTNLTIENHGELVSYENGVLRGRAHMFNVGGRVAFPVDMGKVSPSIGDKLSSLSIEDDSNIRKILYYGFEGPSQLSGWDNNNLRVATSSAISEARNSDGGTLGKRLLNQVKGLEEPPSSFTVYLADIDGNSNQDLVFWMSSEKGSVKNNNTNSYSIIDQYIEGIKMLPEQVEARKNKATELGLLDFVDENYFLFDSFYEGKSEEELENMGVQILVNTVTSSELDAYVENLQNGITPLKVTYYEKVSYGSSIVGKFEVDGSMAFCTQHSKRTPAKGSPTGPPSSVSNDMMRKALYYGYGGPGQLSNMTGNYGWVVTSLAVSKANGDKGANLANNFYNTITGLPSPPGNFNVYKVSSNGGTSQDLAYWSYSPKGEIQISKESSNPAVTNGNNNYSVAGAEYSVYTNSNATGYAGVLTIGSNGWSNILDLNAGTYYIKETKAPKGYALDPNIYPVTVSSGSKTTRTFQDAPLYDPIGMLIRKVDADTGNNKPQGSGSLADAHFTVKYYSGDYAEGVDPGDQGIRPTRTWVMRTDSDGFTILHDTYKVSGDPLYVINGSPTLPLGTITIQETKAPVGYKINNTIFVRKIKQNAQTGHVVTYNEPVVREDSLNFTIKKVQSGTNILLPNVRFKHTKPNGTTEILTTGANGEIALRGIEQGIHKIVEVQATEGFEINPSEFVFEVTSNGTIRVISNTTNMDMLYSELNGDGILTVGDKLSPFKIKIVKVNDKNTSLEGAEFTLYEDSNGTREVAKLLSNVNGEILFPNLEVGKTYYFKETKAPAGYRIPLDANGKVHMYEVTTHAEPSKGVFDFTVDGVRYNANSTTGDIKLEGSKADRVVSIKVVNAITMKLPATGSGMMMPLMLAGTLMMSSSIVFNKKKSKNRKRV